ncbi:MAG TPA: hypothetical protein DCL54_00540, partial [Alphaproteobacteria bacterium]|nr:hypothetical protein [Alphaproteobacteria bacterium]
VAPAVSDDGGLAVRLTGQGRAALASLSSKSDFARNKVLETRIVAVEDGAPVYATVNAAESPLAWLRARSAPSDVHRPTDAQFEAGERLRADFTLAQMGPRLTVDWSNPLASGRNHNGQEALSDLALGARARVRAAMVAVGPGLSDVLMSVCCFLQGLEETESERRWPRRSAKILLKFALAKLAIHYGLERETASGAPQEA